MIPSHSTNHNLVPSKFSGLSNRHKFDFPDLDVSNRNHFMWGTRRESPLDYQEVEQPLKPTMAWKSWISLRHDLHSKTYARSITNGNTSDGGFHGSLARFYGLFNHERYCPKHTMITSMNEYNSEVYKSDWILTREYFSRHSLFLTCSWSSSVESGSLPNSRIWLLPQTWEKGIDPVRLESTEWYRLSSAGVYQMARPS